MNVEDLLKNNSITRKVVLKNWLNVHNNLVQHNIIVDKDLYNIMLKHGYNKNYVSQGRFNYFNGFNFNNSAFIIESKILPKSFFNPSYCNCYLKYTFESFIVYKSNSTIYIIIENDSYILNDKELDLILPIVQYYNNINIKDNFEIVNTYKTNAI